MPPTAFDTTGSASSENIRCQTGCTSDDFDRTHHIRSFLYAVAPTFIRTPGTEDALANPQFRKEVIEHIAALHRIGEPADVTGAVIFLASPAASLITGHTILIDGGWTAI